MLRDRRPRLFLPRLLCRAPLRPCGARARSAPPSGATRSTRPRARAEPAARSRRPPSPADAARRAARDRRFGCGDGDVERRDLARASRSSAARSRLDALAQLLDLALGRQDAARLGACAALDMRAAEHIAVERRDRRARHAVRADAPASNDPRNPGVAEHFADRVCAPASDLRRRHRDERASAPAVGGRDTRCVRRRVGAPTITNPQRPALCAREPARGRRPPDRAVDDDVLEQIAEARLDGALVAAVDLEVVGDRRPAGRPRSLACASTSPRARRRTRRGWRRAPRATPAGPRAPARSCSRARTARARHRARSRAPASSDSRAAAIDAQSVRARRARGAAPRRRRRVRASTLSRFDAQVVRSRRRAWRAVSPTRSRAAPRVPSRGAARSRN